LQTATTSIQQVAKIDYLLKALALAGNYANQQVIPGITSKTTIQSFVDRNLRKKFG
jgi:hypothetical protein